MSQVDPQPTRRWRFERLSLGDVIQTALLIAALVAGWYKFDYRVASVEDITTTNRATIEQVRQTMQNLNETLGKLNQRLEDFPLHRHVPGDGIIYPGGADVK